MEKSAVLWLVITGYSVLIAIVYLCNGEMDVCYEIKDSQFIDIPNTIDSRARINGWRVRQEWLIFKRMCFQH